MKPVLGNTKRRKTSPSNPVASRSKKGLEHFSTIVENTLDGIFLTIPDTGEIVFANPAALTMLDMTEDEAKQVGRDGIVVHDEAYTRAIEERALQGKWRGELTFRRKDGSIFPVEVSSSFFTEQDGMPMVTMSFADITVRRRGEEVLRESEEKYRAVVEHSNDGIIMVQDGRVTYANPRMAELDHSTVDLLVGSPITDHIDPEDIDKVTDMYRKRIRGEPVPSVYQTRLKRNDGSRAYAELNVAMTQYQGRPAVLATIRDITERKRMTDALKDSEERFHGLFDTLPLGVALIDPKTLRCVLFNDAMAGQLGYSPDEFAQLTLDGIEALHDRETIRRNHDRMIKGERMQFETRLRHRSGSTVEALVTAAPITMNDKTLILSIVADITARKQADEALRLAREELEKRVEERTAELSHQRRLLQTIFDHIPVMLTLCTTTGEVIFTNKEVEQKLGWSAEDLGRTDIMAQCYPDPEYRREVQEFMLNPGPLWKDMAVCTKNGELLDTRWMNVRMSDGYQIGIGIDITEQLRLEEQLRHAQKMEALGTMAGGVAHDFNNILAAVIGFAEMTKEDLPESSAERYHLDQILRAGLRGRDLVKQMLTFSRKQDQGRRPLRLSDAIGETMKLLRASIPTTIEIRLDIESESSIVMADPTQIQQVMINLCNNAADAMRESGGVLTIRLEELTVSDRLRVAGLSPGPYVKLSVADTGTGMDRHVLDHVFEPFFTTKEPGKGTGLGLSVVHGIVMNHGGEIIVDSRPGRGTTFTIFLPQVQEKTVQEEEAVAMEANGGGERVLFVDDEKALVDMATEMMQKLGYRVTGKTSSRETLDTFKHDPAAFDLIISDQTMPEMTGLQLSRELKFIREIPVILATGYSQAVNDESAKQAGVDAVVMKPLTKDELARAIRRVLSEKKVKRAS